MNIYHKLQKISGLYAKNRVPLFPRGMKSIKNFWDEQNIKEQNFSKLSKFIVYRGIKERRILIALNRVSGILAAELQQQKMRQFLQPAAYPECELRRIVCWLLIVSAEI